MAMKIFAAAVSFLTPLTAGPAFAWGDEGHEITGLIAYAHLTPAVRAKVDALLASDPDTLTAADFASRTTWADKYRNDHRETANWHFVDVELDHPDLKSGCFALTALGPGQLASQGPANDCIVDKIDEFSAELRKPATPPAERRLALKFLIHFVGDLHQPLHASDHNDKGGNCIGLAPSNDYRSTNLHAYWDTGVIQQLGGSPVDIATRLDREITPAEFQAWSAGDAKTWEMESFTLAKTVAYNLPSKLTCDEHGMVSLSPAYETAARRAAILQLEKAGVRIAYVLNKALDQ